MDLAPDAAVVGVAVTRGWWPVSVYEFLVRLQEASRRDPVAFKHHGAGRVPIFRHRVHDGIERHILYDAAEFPRDTGFPIVWA